MADIDLARQMERLLTEMQGMREEMGSIYAELNSMRTEMANMRDDMRSMRDEIRALHHGTADGWLRAVHGAGAWRNIWIAQRAISALAIDCRQRPPPARKAHGPAGGHQEAIVGEPNIGGPSGRKR